MTNSDEHTKVYTWQYNYEEMVHSVKYLGVSWAPAARRTGWRRRGCPRQARRLQPYVFVPTCTREEN